MRLLALAVIAAAATTGWSQSVRPAPHSPSSTGPSATLPETRPNPQPNANPAPNPFHLNPQFAPDLQARNQAPMLFPRAKGMPIPTEWPDAKFEPIPTDWPNLKFLLVNNPSQLQPKPKPTLKLVK
ncbi:MAG TPA: hypothetical protein VN151_06570 [Terracidiphilus sp.]|nr:hypothetical protein [Terracidiphilus sp.]